MNNPLPQSEPEYGIRSAEASKKPKAKKGLVIVLILLVIAAGGYIAYGEYNDYMEIRYNEIGNYAQLFGQQQMLLEILDTVLKCEHFPVTIPSEVEGQAVNQTINLIAVECLQQAGEQNG